MTDQAPRLQFDLDADAIRLLHRSVAYYLERWPGGPDPREQQDLQTLQRLLYAALLECTLHEDGRVRQLLIPVDHVAQVAMPFEPLVRHLLAARGQGRRPLRYRRCSHQVA